MTALDYNHDGHCEYLEFAAACLQGLGEEFEEQLQLEFKALQHKNSPDRVSKAGLESLLSLLSSLEAIRHVELRSVAHPFKNGGITPAELCLAFGIGEVAPCVQLGEDMSPQAETPPLEGLPLAHLPYALHKAR
eukprot:1823396-Amphidinium_carterae.1